MSFEPILALPSRTELDGIVETIESLRPEMRSRLQKTLSEYGEHGWHMKLDDGESYSVNVDEFAEDGTFIVTWSGGATWGTLGADFTIKDGAIIEEGWGD